jgi:hypothetical protein
VAQSSPAAPALSEAQLAELRAARKRARKIGRAAGVARIRGWVIALFATTSLAWGLAHFGLGSADWRSVAIGAGMGLIACAEFTGARLLRRFDVRGARLLGAGELVFGALIVGYAAWSLAGVMAAPANPDLAALDPEMAANFAAMTRSISVLVWVGVGALGLIEPGLVSLYYFTRAGHVRRFNSETPEWVTQALRAAW